MRRRRILLLAAAGVVVFLGLSLLLARWLSLENVERSAVVVLLEDEARGDAKAMLAQLHGCDSHCRSTVIADARRLRRPGHVQILAYQSQSAYSLTTTVADTRVAWKSSLGRFPVVQCVKVERKGNAISGLQIRLLTLSVQIPDTADC
ncbi:MAG: hypothetical protein ABSB73_07300 [Solirubrobacteraceae bacterium]